MKRILSLLFVLVALTCLAPAASFADTATHEDAGVSVWTPDDWKSDIDDATKIVTSPDEEVMIAFMVLEANELDAALELMEAELSKFIQNIEGEGEPEETEINGLKAIVAEGSGEVDGEEVELGLALIQTPKGKVLMVVGVGSEDGIEKHGAQIEKVLGSIKGAK